MDHLTGLMAIGFTEYEARLYLALLHENPATGYQLSKSAGIPRSMVYEALGRLHGRGAVLKTEERRATLFRPVPPEMLLERYEQEQRSLYGELRQGLQELYSATEEERLWSISGRSAVLTYAAQMIQAAEVEVLLVLADEHLEALGTKIRAACGGGVAIKALLTGAGSLDCGEIARHPPLESELQEMTGLLLVVVDGRECLIASAGAEISATVTTNRNLVLIARQFVWMELFSQRIYTRLGPELLKALDVEDRRVFGGLSLE